MASTTMAMAGSPNVTKRPRLGYYNTTMSSGHRERGRCGVGQARRAQTHHKISGRGVASQARHAVKVGVVAGEVREPMVLHDRHDQSVVAQQAGLLAEGRCGDDPRRGDSENLDAALENAFDSLAKNRQLLHPSGMLPQALCNAVDGPAELLNSLDGHQPMGGLTEY